METGASELCGDRTSFDGHTAVMDAGFPKQSKVRWNSSEQLDNYRMHRWLSDLLDHAERDSLARDLAVRKMNTESHL